MRWHMKRIGLIVIMLLFVLTGCKEINRSIALAELTVKVDDYLDGSNQFDVETSINLSMDDQGKMYYAGDAVSMQIQREPYYVKLVDNGDVLVETMRNHEISMYTYNIFNRVDGIQLYEKSKIQTGSNEHFLDLLRIDMVSVDVKKVSNDHYEMSGKAVDYVSEEVRAEFRSILAESGLTNEEVNSTTVDNVFMFDGDTFTYKVTMNISVREMLVKVVLKMDFSYSEFEPIDFTDDTKYYPLNSGGTLLPIDSTKPILFRHAMPYDSTYYTYLEPGRYGITSNGYDDSELSISISDDSLDKKALLVFKDIYDSDISNPHNVSHLFEIKEAGYYYLDVHYPLSYSTYQLDIINIDAQTNWLEEDALVVTESGTYDYEIESRYDFFPIEFDLDHDSIIFITSSEDTQIYRKDNLHDHYISMPISDRPVEYFYRDDSTLYIHDSNYQGRASVTFDIKPLIHSTTLEEPLVDMKDYPNEDYFYTGNRYPNQYVKLEVTETAQYTFQTKFDVFDGTYPEGELYNSQNQRIARIHDNTDVTLTPGSYYYKTLNNAKKTYCVYYTKDTNNITYLNDVVIGETNVIGDLPAIEMPHFDVTFQKQDEIIIASFELTEPQEIVFAVSKHFVLFDDTGKIISLSNLNVDYFNYALDSGKYYIMITQTYRFESSYYPYTKIVPLGIFTGGEADDSKYGSYPSISIGQAGLVLRYDYPGDIDGVTFTLTENKVVYITGSSNIHFFFGDRLIYDNFKSGTFVLSAGTYTIMSSGYPEDFHIVVDADDISE